MAKKKATSRPPRAGKAPGLRITVHLRGDKKEQAAARRRLVALVRKGTRGTKRAIATTENPCDTDCEFIGSAQGWCYYLCPDGVIHSYLC